MIFVVDKAALGQVFSEYFDFLCHFSSNKMFCPHYHPGLVQ
jgi:hypothetical protein